MEQAKAVPIAERLRQIQIGSYSINHGSHFKHLAVAPVCQEAAAEIERLQSERAILRDSAKDVIAWCDANPPAGDALYCITRLRYAIAATEPSNVGVEPPYSVGSNDGLGSTVGEPQCTE